MRHGAGKGAATGVGGLVLVARGLFFEQLRAGYVDALAAHGDAQLAIPGGCHVSRRQQPAQQHQRQQQRNDEIEAAAGWHSCESILQRTAAATWA